MNDRRNTWAYNKIALVNRTQDFTVFWHILIVTPHLMLTTNPAKVGTVSYFHFTDGQPKAQEVQVTCSKVTRKLGFRFRPSSVRAHISDHSCFLLFFFKLHLYPVETMFSRKL